MFEVGFQELILIMVVALLVIGPERMPGLARKAGMWVGKARRFIGQVKEDIDREIAADELKRLLEEQKKQLGVHEIIEETKETIDETRDSLEEAKHDYLLKSMDDMPVADNDKVIEQQKLDDKQGKQSEQS